MTGRTLARQVTTGALRRGAAVLTLALLAAMALAFAAGCGYRAGGRAVLLPPHIHTIAIPAFRNETTRYKVEQVLTQAVVREFMSRTRYRVQPEVEDSDAVLNGVVTGFWTTPMVVEPAAGRTISVMVGVRMRVELRDSKTGQIVYQNPGFTFTEPYEISGQAATYFEESGPALERMGRQFAASLVSSILETF
jgi:hypothetical protein